MSARAKSVLAVVALLMSVLAAPATAASTSDSQNNGTGVTQTQYLYYNTSTCQGGNSAQMYKTTIKWTRSETTYWVDSLGGTWGYVAMRCSDGVKDMQSRTLGAVSSITYGSTYSYNYTWPYVTNYTVWTSSLGANQQADVYRGTTYKTQLCTQTYVWADSSAC